jgi:hypothetical protein
MHKVEFYVAFKCIKRASTLGYLTFITEDKRPLEYYIVSFGKWWPHSNKLQLTFL